MYSEKSKIYPAIIFSIEVVISIIFAYVVQYFVENLHINIALGGLSFILVFPIILISTQTLFSKLFPKRNLILDFTKSSQVVPQKRTIESIRIFKEQLNRTLASSYEVNDFDLSILDWQTNSYFNVNDTQDYSVTLNFDHALVRFLKEYKTPYITERFFSEQNFVSDAAAAEMEMFMKRHHYVFVMPLYRKDDIYGFIFLNLKQIKDTKLYALSSFESLNPISEKYAQLLQTILVYDAIVLNSNYK